MRMEAADSMRTPRTRNASFDHARRYAVIAGQLFRIIRAKQWALGLAGALIGRLLFRLFGLFPALDKVAISLRDVVAAVLGSLLVLIVWATFSIISRERP